MVPDEAKSAAQRTRKSKRERFLEMAEKRTNAVLQKLQVLGNCSNRQSYEYTREDVEKIFTAIDQRLAIIRAKFEHDQEAFRLR